MNSIVLPEIYENEDLRKEYFYHKEWRYKMMEPLTIKVFAPYEIIENEEKKYIVSSSYVNRFKEGYRNGVGNMTSASHSIYPFDMNELLFEVLKIDVNDEASILDFYNQNGVLGEIRMDYGMGATMIGGSTINFNLCGSYESLDYFIENVQKLQDCFHMYMMIEQKHKPALIKWWKKRMDESIQYAEEEIQKAIEKNNHELIKINKHAKEWHLNAKETPPPIEKIILEVKSRLVNKMNDKLTYTFLNLRVNSNGDFIEGMTSSTLIGVVYYQLYNHIIKGHQFEVCQYCGSYFIPRKKDARFCPSNKPNEHGKCQNRYNAMIRRIREWHFKQGLSIEEIQDKIKKPRKLPLHEIQEYIDRYNGSLKH
jgi:hypothetical protein